MKRRLAIIFVLCAALITMLCACSKTQTDPAEKLDVDDLMEQVAEKDITLSYAKWVPDEAFGVAKVYAVEQNEDQYTAYVWMATSECVALKGKVYDMSGANGFAMLHYTMEGDDPKLTGIEWQADGEDGAAWLEEKFPRDAYQQAKDEDLTAINEELRSKLMEEAEAEFDSDDGDVVFEKDNLLEVDPETGHYQIIKTVESGTTGDDYTFDTEVIEEGNLEPIKD